MNYANIKTFDTANGTGIRTSLFVSGCRHHCKGCFQPQTWDFNFGNPYTKEVEDSIIESLAPVYSTGLTILGGEPMEPENQESVYNLIKRVKETYPDQTVWVYSGYTYEELTDVSNKRCHTEFTDGILDMIDVLVDGEFVLEKKSAMLNFRGSSNQRIINMPETRQSGEIVLNELNNSIEVKR